MKTLGQLCFAVIGILILWFFPAGASPLYPVKISSVNPRILIDQNNSPFLMVGDSPQSVVVNLSAADAASYLADRATNGFNTVLVDAICTTYTYGPANASLLDGTLPFTNKIQGTSSYDLTTPNEAYFAYLDQVINLAGTNGIAVMLDPIETGGWLTTMLDNGLNNCRAYGQYLGKRYKNFPNLIWCDGNDFQTWATPANDAVVLAVAQGIKDTDTNHLQTIESDYYLSSSLDDTNWMPIVGLNAAYTYSPTYAEVLHAYNQSSVIPTFMVEANYENEQNTYTDGGYVIRYLRMQEYWTMLSGASGQVYGNFYTARFTSGWQANLDTPGVTQLSYMANFFGSRAWYNLVPDPAHAFVTGGYGIFTNGVSGNGSGSSGTNILFANNNYVTAAVTPDGSLGMAYLPQGGTITVDMSKLQNTITASWFDPSVNSFTNIVGSPFSNTGTRNFTTPGKNNAGDPDWILVLEKPPAPTGLVTTAGTNQVALQWNATVGANNYTAFRSTTSGSSYTALASLAVTNYLDTNVVAGTKYYYVVNVSGASGTSGYSGEVSAIPLLPTPVSPTISSIYVDGSGYLVFDVPTQTGYNYYLESTTNLTPLALWSTVIIIAGNGQTITTGLPINRSQPSTFFRYLVR